MITSTFLEKYANRIERRGECLVWIGRDNGRGYCCPNGHPFDIVIRRSDPHRPLERRCTPCTREQQRLYRARRRAKRMAEVAS